MAVEPKVKRILDRLKAELVDKYPSRYTTEKVLLEFPSINPQSPPASDTYYIFRDKVETVEIYDDREISGKYTMVVKIYCVFVADGEKPYDLMVSHENKISNLINDFVNLFDGALTSSLPYEDWVVGKRFVEDVPPGFYAGNKTSDAMVIFEIDFENRGSFFTTS